MEDKRSGPIKRFFLFWWNLLDKFRRFVFNLLFLLVLIFVVIALFSEEAPSIPASSVLVVNPSGALVDQISYVDPFSNLISGNNAPPETLLPDLVKAIDRAATDSRIKMMVLETDALEHSGISKSEELSAAISRFRDHKKSVVAVGDSYNQDQYLIAAQADRVFMNPMGQVLLQGFGVYTNFFKEALDKLQVSVHIFRVGTYKSAVEPFMRDDMSAEVKSNHRIWLDSLWQQYKNIIAAQRQLAPEKVDEYVEKIDAISIAAQGDSGKAAVDWHLVDELKTREQINDWLVEQVGADENGDFRNIDFRDYLSATNHHRVGKSGDKIGIIVASGVILDGEQRAGQIGGDTLANLIRQARDDDQIKAVVLRIDSEGGSAFAAEIIRQELLSLKEAGKPLIVSMGSIAASGGYWIAANADEVWATPGTITGSIGIFGAFPTFEKSLDKLGIHTDGVGTTALAGAMRIDKALDPVAARAIQSNIDNGYQRFLRVVSEGRGIDVVAVDKIAQGQVWAGSDALKIGLVDKLGDLSAAVASAAEHAQLKHYDMEWVEPPISVPEVFFQKLSGATSYFKQKTAFDIFAAASVWAPLKPLLGGLQKFALLNDPKAMYVYCEICTRL